MMMLLQLSRGGVAIATLATTTTKRQFIKQQHVIRPSSYYATTRTAITGRFLFEGRRQRGKVSSSRLVSTTQEKDDTTMAQKKTMLAIQVHEIGDESKLLLNANTPIPKLVSSTEVLVENHYAGLNFHDTYTRSGLYPMTPYLPFVVGCEGGGIVKKVGKDVNPNHNIKVGDRVVYLQEGPNGSYAQYTSIEYTRLMIVPDGLDLDIATAAAVQAMTAHYLVNDSYDLKHGQWCLVHAAAGGTGQLIVQMAKKIKGANVIGTCSTPSKAEIAKSMGCDYVIILPKKSTNKDDNDDDTTDVGWQTLAEKVKQIVASSEEKPIKSNYGSINVNDGVHCVYDGVGKDSAYASLESLRPRGTAVFFGNASGPPPDIPPLLLSQLGSITITRPKLHDFIATHEELIQRSSEVFRSILNNEININIQSKVKFNQEGVVRATKMLHDRQTVGKILFDIRQGMIENQQAANQIMSSRYHMATTADKDKKIDKLDSDIAPLTIEDGYCIQDFVVKNIIIKNFSSSPSNAGKSSTKMIGYKIGATSLMAQESVNVKEPFYGNVFEHSTFFKSSPATIHYNELGLQEQFMLIEPEFAIKMSKDLDVGTNHSKESIFDSIGSIFPSVEIATSAFALDDLENFKKIGAPSLIADNGCHGALVLGKEFSVASSSSSTTTMEVDDDSFSKVLDGLDKQRCSLMVNGSTVSTGTGDKVLGHPLNALCWLANQLGKRGESLKKDQIVTTGVVIDKLVLAKVGDTITVDYGDDLLGSVTINFER